MRKCIAPLMLVACAALVGACNKSRPSSEFAYTDDRVVKTNDAFGSGPYSPANVGRRAAVYDPRGIEPIPRDGPSVLTAASAVAPSGGYSTYGTSDTRGSSPYSPANRGVNTAAADVNLTPAPYATRTVTTTTPMTTTTSTDDTRTRHTQSTTWSSNTPATTSTEAYRTSLANAFGTASPETRVLSILQAKELEEIEMGRVAQERGRTQAVRDYGALMVSENTAALNTVRSAAQSAGIPLMDPYQTHEALRRARGEAIKPMVTDSVRVSEAGAYRTGERPKDVVGMLRDIEGDRFDTAFADVALISQRETIRIVEDSKFTVTDQSVQQLMNSALPKLRERERMATQFAVQR